jgi:hypothetical protein
MNRTAMLVSTLVLLAASAWAQMAPKPGPEVKKLDYFVGTWTTEATIAPGPWGAGGKFSATDTTEWMPGSFFVEFNSQGRREVSKGTVSGDTWTWTSTQNYGGQEIKQKMTIKVLTPASYTLKFEISMDGTNWTTFMDGKATKK